ncbi:uncharacterized protein G2W53_017464 [Senna tora]|uniref:BED-type domain-containing protein n=1 Tax=Senna tora TaxID=362788 RepID=A0A834TU38_9FABA|nr:uncharacterized protein G2W53_017464 [Senna tora]
MTRAQPGLTRRVLAKPRFVTLATSLAIVDCGARRAGPPAVAIAVPLCLAVVMSMSSPNPTQETPKSNPNSSSLQTQSNSSRGKSDPAWGHCRFKDETSAKKHLICMYCNKIFKGGGINRIKQHLAGIKGDTESCKKVPVDDRFQMHDNVVNFNQRKQKAQEEVRESTLNSQDQEHEVHHNSEEVREIGSSRGKGKDQGKSTSSGLSSYFMPRTTPGAQPTLKSVLQSKEARERCDLAISKWMVDACLPFSAVNSVYYQPMIDAIANIGKLPEVNEVVDHAEKLTKFIYNHCFTLHLMRTHTGGREILRPAPTRFATNFVALQSILAQKDALRAMVTFKEWTTSSFSRESKSKRFVDAVLDSGFWKNCSTIVKLTEPLIRVLRIVDSEEKPAMGFLYAPFQKAREEMIKRFQRRKRVIEPYLKIIDRRWDKQLYKNLHAAGFWFNPSYHYDTNEMEKHKSVISGVLDVIERYAHNDRALEETLNKEVTIFRNAEGDFGRRLAVNSRNTKMPDEWWKLFGTGAPNLQKLAVRVLSQTIPLLVCISEF